MQHTTQTASCVAPCSMFRAGLGEEANRAVLPTFTRQQHEVPGWSESSTNRTDAISKTKSADVCDKRTSSSTITAPQLAATNQDPPTYHQGRDSTSTSASDSSDSSPTTTISTLDSASMTEPSPGPSPESPASAVSPTSTFNDSGRMRLGGFGASRLNSSQSSFFDMQNRPTTPARKPRNLKNLAVNTATAAANLGRAVSTAHPQLGATGFSAPPSPSFIKPVTPPRRKQPSLNLIIETSQGGLQQPPLPVPPTPSLNGPNQLRHFQSSPALRRPVLSLSPEDTRRPSLHSKRPSKNSFSGASMGNLQEENLAEEEQDANQEDDEPNFDVPQSREEKPESYPNGPIRIYDTGVWLYYEPSADEASAFDVVFNVASEVKNPYTGGKDATTDLSQSPLKVTCDSKIDLALSQAELSRMQPLESRPSPSSSSAGTASTQDNSPTTPKATPLPIKSEAESLPAMSRPMPEYIHIPWEHNADIVPDLHRLVRIVDDRVQSGKRVLIHCQCGVSRSASLIVAYGLYKNPGISVQEAYDAVKKRSKWIGPNMNLIMQLQEFRSAMLAQRADKTYRTPGFLSSKASSHGMSTHSDSLTAGLGPNGPTGAAGPLTPRTAPLPPQHSDKSSFRSSTGSIPPSPGPLSAPPAWAPGSRNSWDVGHPASPGPDFTPASPTAAVTATSPVPDSEKFFNTTAKTPELVLPQEPQNSTSLNTSSGSFRRSRGPVPNFSRQLPLRQDTPADVITQTPSISLDGGMQKTTLLASPRPSLTDLMSPTKTGFPTNALSLSRSHDSLAELSSPRRAEFGMIPLQLRSSSDSGEPRPLLQPSSSGFGSALQEAPITSGAGDCSSLPFRNLPPPAQGRATHPPPQKRSAPAPPAPIETSVPSDSRTPTPKPLSPCSPPSLSPPRQKIRTKYSMPDMQTQRQMQRIQADLEAKLLPSRPSANDLRQRGARSKDDLDEMLMSPGKTEFNIPAALRDEEVLLSPRVSEFTRNPFHDPSIPLPGISEPAPAESIPSDGVPLSNAVSTVDRTARETTPEACDPRSPAVVGVTPITRNIFDVL